MCTLLAWMRALHCTVIHASTRSSLLLLYIVVLGSLHTKYHTCFEKVACQYTVSNTDRSSLALFSPHVLLDCMACDCPCRPPLP